MISLHDFWDRTSAYPSLLVVWGKKDRKLAQIDLLQDDAERKMDDFVKEYEDADVTDFDIGVRPSGFVLKLEINK